MSNNLSVMIGDDKSLCIRGIWREQAFSFSTICDAIEGIKYIGEAKYTVFHDEVLLDNVIEYNGFYYHAIGNLKAVNDTSGKYFYWKFTRLKKELLTINDVVPIEAIYQRKRTNPA